MAYGKTKRPQQSLYMDDQLKQRVVERARRNKRSFNQEVIFILETVLEQDVQQNRLVSA